MPPPTSTPTTPPPPPVSFIVQVTAESGMPLTAIVKGITDSTGGIDTDSSNLTKAFDEVSKFSPPTTLGGSGGPITIGGQAKGGKSRKGRKSKKGGKSKKARKSLRRR